jgi:WD40 repeat protein
MTMKAKQTFVLTSVVAATFVLGLASFLWLRLKEGTLTRVAQNSSAVSSVWFSPDGRQLVTKSQNGTERIWDARTGNLLTNVSKESKVVSAAMVLASHDGGVRVWDVQSGKPVAELPKASGAVTSAWFSPDGKQIITSSQDGTVRVWQVERPSPASRGSDGQQH